MSAARRRALVTGGSGGIGAALCRRLARDGHFVYVHSRRGGDKLLQYGSIGGSHDPVNAVFR